MRARARARCGCGCVYIHLRITLDGVLDTTSQRFFVVVVVFLNFSFMMLQTGRQHLFVFSVIHFFLLLLLFTLKKKWWETAG